MSKIELGQFIPKAPLSFHQEEMKRIVEHVKKPEQEWEIRFSAITISGRSGTGKSVVAQILAEKYGIRAEKNVKTGQLFREITGEQVIAFTERDISLDQRLDDMQIALLSQATELDPLMLEGRLAGIIESERRENIFEERRKALQKGEGFRYHYPVVRILFTAPSDVCYQRIYKREKKRSPDITLGEVRNKTKHRDRGDLSQWRKLHPQLDGIDPFDPRNRDKNNRPIYELVVPTGKLSAEEVAECIHEFLVENKYLASNQDAKKKESEQLTIEYASDLLIFSYLTAQQKPYIQAKLFEYFHSLRPGWRVDDSFKEALSQRTMEKAPQHIHTPKPSVPLHQQVVDHPPVPQEKIEQDVHERVQEMQDALNGKYPTNELQKFYLMLDITQLLIEKEYEFLKREKGRIRINTDTTTPRGDPWFSVICYYAFLDNATGYPVFDEFFDNMRKFIKTPADFHHVGWEADAEIDFVVREYNKHHPDEPVRGFWADPDKV